MFPRFGVFDVRARGCVAWILVIFLRKPLGDRKFPRSWIYFVEAWKWVASSYHTVLHYKWTENTMYNQCLYGLKLKRITPTLLGYCSYWRKGGKKEKLRKNVFKNVFFWPPRENTVSFPFRFFAQLKKAVSFFFFSVLKTFFSVKTKRGRLCLRDPV